MLLHISRSLRPLRFSVVHFCNRGYDCPGQTSARHDARICDSIPFRDFGCASGATLLKVVQLEIRMDEHERTVAGCCRAGDSDIRRRARHRHTCSVRRRRQRSRRPTAAQIRAVVSRFTDQCIDHTVGDGPTVTDVADRTRNHRTAGDDNDDAAVSDALHIHTADNDPADQPARSW